MLFRKPRMRRIFGAVWLLFLLAFLWQAYKYGEPRPEMWKAFWCCFWFGTWVGYRNSGFYREEIQWPNSMTLVMYLYYISLAVLQVALYSSGIIILVWVMDIIPVYERTVVMTIFFSALMVVLLGLSQLSMCWDLHDKWAERSSSVLIRDVVGDWLDTGHFNTATWVLIDFFLALMLWPVFMAFGEPLAGEARWIIWMGLVYANFLILQAYLFFHYRKEGL